MPRVPRRVEEKDGRFDFHAKRVFLTYPNSGELTRERVRDFLVDGLGARAYCIARETHRTGEPHLHAYAEWTSRFRARDCRAFDVDGHHPHVSTVRSPSDSITYLFKEDPDPLRNVNPVPNGLSYGELIKQSTTGEEFLRGVVSEHPRDAALRYENLQYFAREYFKPPEPDYEPGDYRFDAVPTAVAEWVSEYIQRPNPNRGNLTLTRCPS